MAQNALGPQSNLVLWEPSLPEHTQGSLPHVTCTSRHENMLVLQEPHLPERIRGQPHAFAYFNLASPSSQALHACPATHLSLAFVLAHSALTSKALFINSSALPPKPETARGRQRHAALKRLGPSLSTALARQSSQAPRTPCACPCREPSSPRFGQSVTSSLH